MILTQRRFCTKKKKILIKFKISMHINDQHFYIEFLYQTRVENTKNSFSPFTKDLLTIKYNVNNKKSAWRVHLKPITRLEANLIAQRALYRLGPRGKLWPGSESLEIERLWIPFAQLTYNAAVKTPLPPFDEHLGLSSLVGNFRIV